MSSRTRSNVFQTLNVERLTCDYLHLNQTPIRVNGYPFGTADLANTANFITAGSLQQADWLTVNTNSASFIRNKPDLAKVAVSGNFADLSDAPALVPVNADWTQQDQTQLSYIANKPSVSKAGSSGLYSDLVAGSGQPTVPTSVDYDATSSTATTLAISNKPPLPVQPVNADWAVPTASSLAFIRNKPSLSAVALSGSFGDLLNRPVVYQTVDWAASANSGTTLAITNRPEIPPAPVNADWTAPSGPAAILNKPVIPDSQVNSDWNANTGPAAILNKPRVPPDQINSDWLATQGSVAYIANRPAFGKVAISDDYNDLKNLPPIPPQQQPSDWNAVSGPTFIQNKPSLQSVATSGKYSELLANSGQPVIPSIVDWSLSASTSSTLAVKNRPSIPAPQVQSDWSQKDNLQISFIANKPSLAAVALSGSYNDLADKPTTSSGVMQSDWTQQDSTQASYINNKPLLKTVATTGNYSDLVANSGQPQTVTAADWNATTASGGVIPVTSKPQIPAAQINSDWNSTSGLSQILNQPAFGLVAFSNKYTDLSNLPALGRVATSNLYSDLTNAPRQADYSLLASTTTSLAIINRPTVLSAFSNDAGYYKANDSPLFGSVTASAGISSGGSLSAVDGVFSGNLTATQLTLKSGAQVAFLNIPGSQVVNLGSDQAKAANAGSIGYQTVTAGALDIYGAGTAVGSRGVKLWDNVVVPGTLAVAGSISTPALTVAGASVFAQVNADWNATSGVAQILNKPTKLTQFTNDLTGSSGDWNVPGALTVNTSINVPNGGTNVLNLGSNLTKETNAGKIGYALLTTGGLDVVGAGTAAGSRVIKLWDNVTVPGTLAVAGSISTPALTVAGASVFAQVNADWNATSGVAQILNKPTKLTQFTNDLTGSSAGWSVPGTLSVSGTASTGALTSSSVTATGLLTANTGINVLGTNVLNFGSNVTKESNAGKIGYQTIDVGFLNIIGAGTSVGTRQVKFYDTVTVNQDTNINRNLVVTGSTRLGGNQYIKVYTQNVSVPAVGASNSYTLPSGVTSSNVISMTGVIYTSNVTYPFGLTQDNDYNMRAWINLPNSLMVLNYGNQISGSSATVTYIVAG